MNGPEAPQERFLTVKEVAALFRQRVEWVHRARWKVLRPAARKFGSKLLFDRVVLEEIIRRSADSPP